MKPPFALLLVGIFAAASPGARAAGMAPAAYSAPGHPIDTSHAGANSITDRPMGPNQKAGAPKVEVSVATEEKGKAATTFPSNAPKLFASFRTVGTTKGDKMRGVWVLQNGASKKKLYENTLTGDRADFVGSFSINGPATGWPPGKYRVELYLGNKLAATAGFTVVGKGG